MDVRRQQLAKRLEHLGMWHHAIDLGDGLVTAAHATSAYDPELRWQAIRPYLPDDLSGKSVLDLGCNSGYFSVKVKQLGADRVVGVDTFDGAIKQAEFLAEWFDVEIELICEDAHVFCLTCAERFDYVIFMGLFYHLKYGTLVLDRLAEMAKSLVFFQTVRLDTLPHEPEVVENYEYHLHRQDLLVSPNEPRMTFIERKLATDLSNWWLANHSAILAILRSAGFKIIAETKEEIFICQPDQVYGKAVYDKCVFPRYGKVGSMVFPLRPDKA